MTKSFYEILGIAPNATDVEIKQAYHRLAREYHPDKAKSPKDAVTFEELMGAISAAYNTLKDSGRRAAYDKMLSPSSGKSPTSGQSLPQKTDQEKPLSATVPQQAMPVPVASPSPAVAATQHVSNVDAKQGIAKRAFYKGMQLYLSGDFGKSVDFFETAVQNCDTEPLYFARLAQAMMKSRRSFTRMVEAAEKAVHLDPYKSEYRLIMAEIYKAANMPTKELAVCKELLKWDPENVKALARVQELTPQENVPFWKKLFGSGK